LIFYLFFACKKWVVVGIVAEYVPALIRERKNSPEPNGCPEAASSETVCSLNGQASRAACEWSKAGDKG
jgi:hypothetical protein